MRGLHSSLRTGLTAVVCHRLALGFVTPSVDRPGHPSTISIGTLSLSSLSSPFSHYHHQSRVQCEPRTSAFQSPPPTTACQSRTSSTSLSSVQRLIDQVSEPPAASSASSSQTIFVGGKGGVGKTTVSSALAVLLASDPVQDLRVLVVSTDPAHSLGDALDEDLSRGRGQPIVMTDPLTGGRLSACEVDAAAALEDFKENLAAFDLERLADALGVSSSLLESLGLGEFSNLLQNPPPGLDELVALSNVLDRDDGFDVVVVDTAPTGHTLRLLALPQFLDGLLGKLINLRAKLSKLTNTLQAFFGSEQAAQRAQAIDDATQRLETFRSKMTRLRQRLTDASSTRFVVVTVPTKLGVAESKRLLSELGQQDVSVTDVVVNQCVGDGDADEEALQNYYHRRMAGQQKWIGKLTEAVSEVSDSEEYKSNDGDKPIAVTNVPFFDVELVGVPALAYVGSQTFMENPNFAHLMDTTSSEDDQKVVICGGKGGVGKTTTSSSLAVSMAAKGHKVALISTDPAHSLGDAIDMDLSGGQLQDCPLIGVPPSEGSLSVLEIDPATAIKDFKATVDKLVGAEGGDDGIGRTLKEVQEVFDTLPAGTDEVVALAKIVNLVKKGGFDRIVLDTAPTGHTLRMLSTPGFLADLMERLLSISERINSNSAVRMLIASSSRAQEIDETQDQARSALLKFQLQMYDLEDLFANAEQTEFLIVTVATELAVRESMRLLNDLTFEAPDLPIKVRNVVINQVLREDGTDIKNFLSHLSSVQSNAVQDLEQTVSTLANAPFITRVQYLDTEPRGVFGLKILADALVREDGN